MNPIIMYISLPAIILFFFLFYNMNASLQCLQISMMPDFSSVSFTFVQQEYKTMFSLCSFRRLLDTVSSRRQIDGMACLSSSIFFYLLQLPSQVRRKRIPILVKMYKLIIYPCYIYQHSYHTIYKQLNCLIFVIINLMRKKMHFVN